MSDWTSFAGCDPAYNRDAFAGCVVHRKGDEYRVGGVFERRPARGKPLVPSDVTREFGEWSVRLGAKTVMSDVHYQEQLRNDLAGLLAFVDEPGGNSGKATTYERCRELIHAGRIKWSVGHRELTRQLREVIARPIAGGLISIQSPRRRGAHGDVVSAFVRAVYLASSNAAGMTAAEREACRASNQRLRAGHRSMWAGVRGKGF